jgi:putative transposase
VGCESCSGNLIDETIVIVIASAPLCPEARGRKSPAAFHVITRGNNRRRIFNHLSDYQKFLSLLAIQKIKLPFFLYAYCLMSNHVHLLIERQTATVGRIMQRLLTGYAQYYNRRYRRVGHLFQGRYKAVLCESDRYLSELVRYIHLNPVRAGIVNRAEDYESSSHRAYLGLEPPGVVDVDSVLRHFGAKKQLAREAFQQFVAAGIAHGHCEELYAVASDGILGSDEFVDATIHRIGKTEPSLSRKQIKREGTADFNLDLLIATVEKICEISRKDFFGSGKYARAVAARELFIVAGCELGASLKVLAERMGLNSGTASRRHDAGKARRRENPEVARLVASITEEYKKPNG